MKDSLFSIITYFMQTAGVYFIYATLIYIGVKNTRQISKWKEDISKDSEDPSSPEFLEMRSETDEDRNMEEIIQRFQAVKNSADMFTDNKEITSEIVEPALIGIEIMKQIQIMAKRKNVFFVLDADEGVKSTIQVNKVFIEQGLELLADIYLENCHSGNEIRMKVTENAF